MDWIAPVRALQMRAVPSRDALTIRVESRLKSASTTQTGTVLNGGSLDSRLCIVSTIGTGYAMRCVSIANLIARVVFVSFRQLPVACKLQSSRYTHYHGVRRQKRDAVGCTDR